MENIEQRLISLLDINKKGGYDFQNFNLACLLVEGMLKRNEPVPQNVLDLIRSKMECIDDVDPEWMSLPEFALNSVKCVDISDVWILAEVPEWIREIKNLQRLSLSGNFLLVIPEWIEKLVNLEYLNLSTNYLESLSEKIGELQNLQYLHLKENKLTSLPEEIGNLENLKELSLDGNQLTSLPRSIVQLKHLKYLYLRGNPIEEVPESIIPWLQKLDFGGNEVLKEKYK